MQNSTASEMLLEFKSIFVGAQERFVIHVPPFSQSENNHKVNASWVGWAQYGKGSFIVIPEGYEKGSDVPVTIEQYRAHLNGVYGVAISPLIGSVQVTEGIKENVCAYGIIDIDVYSENFAVLINRLYNDGFKFAAFRSKSGGLHIYFLFSIYEPAEKVQSVLRQIMHKYGLSHVYKDSKNNLSKIEIFPEHTEQKIGRKDKGVLLPFYNAAKSLTGEYKTSLLDVEGNSIPLPAALSFIKKQFTTVESIQDCIDSLPYSDAPYCVQAILLSGFLWEGSYRNNFLFTTALYLKQKHGVDAFSEQMLLDANERLAEPLEAEQVHSCYVSALNGDFPVLGQCKKYPMVSFCDKAACKDRVFSAIKKDKQNVASNVEFGLVYRMKAETPYYLLEARLAGTTDSFKLLRVDAAENFLNQRVIQRECIDKLGQVMWTVKQAVWEERLNAVMAKMQEKDVTAETDTTELSDLRGLFYRYLTHRQVASNMPYRINLKQVYFKDEIFYFKTEGLKDYLRIAKYNLGRTNLREQLISYGCKEGEITYARKDGSLVTIRCWLKPTDNLLATMTTYFEDIIQEDANIVAQNKIQKQEDEDLDEDERF